MLPPQRGAMFIEHDVPKLPRSSGAQCVWLGYCWVSVVARFLIPIYRGFIGRQVTVHPDLHIEGFEYATA